MKRNRKLLPQYAVFVEGECEFWYIQMLKRNERVSNIKLEPIIPQRKKLSEQYERVVALSKDYDKVFWIVDFDVIIKETKEAKKGAKTALQEFKEYVEDIRKNNEKIVVIINNPCFEYWLLLHYETTTKYYASYDDLEKQLKKYLSDYEKTQRYYTKQNKDVYLRLVSKLSTAISNSKKLDEFDLKNIYIGVSQMYLFFEEKELKKIIAPI